MAAPIKVKTLCFNCELRLQKAMATERQKTFCVIEFNPPSDNITHSPKRFRGATWKISLNSDKIFSRARGILIFTQMSSETKLAKPSTNVVIT